MKRWFLRVAGILVVGAIGLAAWQLPGTARLLSQTSAKWACQCRYIDGGPSDAFCMGEDPLGFGGMNFMFHPDQRAVRVDIYGMVPAVGRFEAPGGCMVSVP